ncbi:MAG: DUF1223 domain-containing protein [Rhodomicrobiaceae bacterium]
MHDNRSCIQTLRKAILVAVLAGASLLVGITSPAWSAEQKKRTNLLELFTSQGCSSCPPADALLRQLSKRANVLALSFPVSYWDHLGWKDTLAKDAYNERQRAYAEARGDRQIYTPQLIVNGMVDVVGSQSDEIEEAMKNTDQVLRDSWVPVSLRYDGNTFAVDTGAAPEASVYRSGKLWLALYSNSVTVAIGRGENTGRSVTYTHVVRKVVPVGLWHGRSANYTVPTPAGTSFDGCAAVLQADKSNAVLGAASAIASSQ